MNKNFPCRSDLRFPKLICACLVVLACASLGRTQSFRDAPVLISDGASTRALATSQVSVQRGRLPLGSEVVWPAGEASRITFFVTNLDLMTGEGANAFRADAQDGAGRRFSLPIESINSLPGLDWIYAITMRLNPDIGDAGDVLIRLNWRGMASNRVRLSIGHVGGGPKDDEGAVPTPAPLVRPKPQDPDGQQQRMSLPFSPDNMRLLEQSTFGPTISSELRLRRLGIRVWLEDQMSDRFDGNNNPRYSTIPYPVVTLWPSNIPSSCTGACIRDNYGMYKLQNWMYLETMYGDDQQLRRRVSWALSQIIVVSGRDTQQPSHLLPYINILDKYAFGNFRSLLYDMTRNPAMGNYLDMVRSTQSNPNENYAREVLQLFSIGLDMLNPDGTPMLDQFNNRIPTYDQTTVNNFTKVFTGWTFCNFGCPSSQPSLLNYIDPLIQVPSEHDMGQKMLLNYPGATPVIPAGLSDEIELRLAIDNIFNHPNVGPFISKLLIQHLVTSNPTPAYVGRVASVFNSDDRGVRGNLKAVVTAILLDPEARGAIKTDPDYGYLKEPVLFVTNLLRAFDPKSGNGSTLSDGVINSITLGMDQDVFNAPSVFNYYPSDYHVPNTNLLGPEYAIMTTGTSLKRPNFVNQMVFANLATGGIPANPANGIPSGTSISMDRMQALAVSDPSGGQLVDALNQLLMHGSMSSSMRTSIMQAVQAVSGADTLKRARTAVYLVATSSQYQVQR